MYITSHDLQEPLRNINSIIEIIQDDFEVDIHVELAKLLCYIYSSATRMSELIYSLVEYSHIGKI